MIALALLLCAHALAEPTEPAGISATLDPDALYRAAMEDLNADIASVPTRYTGRLIALRTLSAARGRLSDENLEPLLRVRQDGIYNPQDVRQDLAMLYRVGHIVQVEVEVEDWPAFDADGNAIRAVHVDYRIYPPDEVRGLRVVGNAHFSAREIQAAIRLHKGAAWFPEDVPKLAAAIHDAYLARGWPDAQARILASTPPNAVEGDNGIDVRIEVEEGEARRISSLNLHTDGAIAPWRARVILLRNGVVRGRPYTEKRIQAAREALLTAVRRRGAPAHGQYEARVSIAVGEDGGAAVFVDGRRAWAIEAREAGLTPKTVADALALGEGARVTRTFDADATDTLNQVLRAAGHLDTDVTLEAVVDPQTVNIRVTGSAGPRSRLGEIVFSGPEGALDAPDGPRIWTQRYLRAAFLEAGEGFKRGRLTPQSVDDALDAMREFYRAEGYLGVTFTRDALTSRVEQRRRGKGRPTLRTVRDIAVNVQPGSRAWLARVSVEGNVGDVDVATMYADLINNPVNPSAIEARARALVDAYGERGYLTADATTDLTLTPDGTRADLLVTVTPGAVVYLRAVLIRGYSRTERFVIEREIRLKPGDPITPDAIAEIRRRLYDLAVFDRVSVEAVGDEDRVKDILIDVSERKNLYAEAGGGLATDQGVRVFARAGHRNLFGLAHTLTLYGQAGIGWLGDGWSFDFTDPTFRATAHYEAPHVPARGESVTGDVLFGAEEQAPDWRLARSGIAAGFSLKVGPFSTLRADYRVQWRRLLDVDPGVLVDGDPWLSALGLTDAEDPSPDTPSDFRRHSGFDLSFLMDLRDDPFNPTRGGVGSTAWVITDPFLSSIVFLRAEGSWTQLVPLGRPSLLLRMRGGAAWVPDGEAVLPVEDRFQGGGGASFRGFSLATLGPANLVSNEDIAYPNTLAPILDYAERTSTGRWVSTGGDALAVGTIELAIPLDVFGLKGWEATRIALFSDAGNVWWASSLVETTSMQRSVAAGGDPLFRYSVGVGLRRSTPVGPVQLDLGFNPHRIEVRGEDWAQVHVSLGNVF